jgi:hypothetical protein
MRRPSQEESHCSQQDGLFGTGGIAPPSLNRGTVSDDWSHEYSTLFINQQK